MGAVVPGTHRINMMIIIGALAVMQVSLAAAAGFGFDHGPVHHAPSYHAPAYHAPLVHAAPIVHAAPAYHAPVYHEEPHPYNYEYGVHDDYSGANFNAGENADGNGNVEGSYSVLLPDGRTQHVKYHADHYTGYVADVQYEGVAHHAPVVHAAPAYHAPILHAPAYHG